MLVGFIAYTWDYLMEYKLAHEHHSNATEFYSLDVFTNFDKIIYRGQSEKEIGEYSEHNRKSHETGLAFHQQSSLLQLALVVFLYLIILGSIWYLITLKSSNRIDTKTFITFFTIILLYRDKITSILQMIPNCMEIQGRIKYIIKKFDELPSEVQIDETPKYKEVSLPFDEIRFENVSYKYNSGSYVFENLNLTLHTEGKIIGLTGPSGRGKSTVMKLLLKLYKYDKGKIMIDGVDISTISPNYIRENITYVNQTAKLFDKPIIDNMMYGCKDIQECKAAFDSIMKYPAVQKLYGNVDFENKTSGSLGENLSGGQRQIVNILSGLVNPSKILILDEPTNALDANLKQELLGIIDAFRQYKKCIIIITHDRDVYPLFDERIQL
jgi:ABC-type multidrug transport system fused ATPase/permease subunit